MTRREKARHNVTVSIRFLSLQFQNKTQDDTDTGKEEGGWLWNRRHYFGIPARGELVERVGQHIV